MLEETNANVQLRREFPDAFLRRDVGDFAARHQIVLQATARRIAGGRAVDAEEDAQIQLPSTRDAEIGVRESHDAPEARPEAAKEPVRDRDAHEDQVGGSSQRHRHRSHRRLQQTVHTANHDGTSSGSQDHNVRHVGGALARRVRRSYRFVQDHRLPVSVRVRGWPHRGSVESLRQGAHRADPVRSIDVHRSQNPDRCREARHPRIPLRILVGTRAESLEALA